MTTYDGMVQDNSIAFSEWWQLCFLAMKIVESHPDNRRKNLRTTNIMQHWFTTCICKLHYTAS